MKPVEKVKEVEEEVVDEPSLTAMAVAYTARGSAAVYQGR